MVEQMTLPESTRKAIGPVLWAHAAREVGLAQELRSQPIESMDKQKNARQIPNLSRACIDQLLEIASSLDGRREI